MAGTHISFPRWENFRNERIVRIGDTWSMKFWADKHDELSAIVAAHEIKKIMLDVFHKYNPKKEREHYYTYCWRQPAISDENIQYFYFKIQHIDPKHSDNQIHMHYEHTIGQLPKEGQDVY